VALSDLGLVTLSTDHVQAATLFRDSLAFWQAVGTKEGFVDWLARVASLAVATQRHELGVQLFGAVERAREAIGYNFELPELARQQQVLATARERLGANRFTSSLQQGQQWRLEEALTQGAAFLETLSDAAALDEAPPGAIPFALTPRELEVLRLLAQRLTDREIAEALYISPKTAGYHVSNILGKLGVADRREAAALAVHLDLV
jgi:DNA-binding CsgD family transcriptional regulator